MTFSDGSALDALKMGSNKMGGWGGIKGTTIY